ncbi:hypothetical protein ACFLTI_02980 [Bacteroidota bacterium]
MLRNNLISSINSSVVQKNVWSVLSNQAGLGYVDRASVGLAYNNRFFLKELSEQKFAFCYPLRFATAAVSYTRFGFDNYNENSVAIAFGKKINNILSIGMQMNYLWYFIADNYGSHGMLIMEFGVLSEPIKGFMIGVHLFNPFSTGFHEDINENGSIIYKFGLGINKLKDLFIELETTLEINNPICFKLNVEYNLVKGFFLKTGIQNNPVGNFFGGGFIKDKLRFDIGFINHQVLGLSPELCLIYSF